MAGRSGAAAPEGEGVNNDDVFLAIVALRGGIPEKCDFCDQPYTDERYPVPEEAGQWTCIECWERWEREDAAKQGTTS